MEEYYIFTFGVGQENARKYVKIYGDYEKARQKMFDKFGSAWAFQYSEEEWKDWEKRRPSWVKETLLCEIK
jgi:hypothetical protein